MPTATSENVQLESTMRAWSEKLPAGMKNSKLLE
jgi:hypothetical protein